MKPSIPDSLLRQARQWAELHRWERAELGRSLRRLGLSYGEIRQIIPVPKGTLSSWCREITLSDAQITALRARRQPIPLDTQRKRRAEIERIRLRARQRVPQLLGEPLWLMGTTLYWGEGSKTDRTLSLTNSDPAALKVFVHWASTYHHPDPRFVLSIHLHEGNDEARAKAYWAEVLGLAAPEFYKSFVKPAGTGHRKNHLPHGICRVLLRRGTDAWLATMEWIDVLRNAELADSSLGIGTLTSGR